MQKRDAGQPEGIFFQELQNWLTQDDCDDHGVD
jgi:hypothetical protein